MKQEKTIAKKEKGIETYTFIMHYRGGVYISQAISTSLDDALLSWARNVNIKDIKHFGEKAKEEILFQLSNGYEIPTPIDAVENVWLSCFGLKTGFARVHIIKTVV